MFSVFLFSGNRNWQRHGQLLLHKPATIAFQLSFCRRGLDIFTAKHDQKMTWNEKRYSAIAYDKQVAKQYEKNGETSFLPSALSFLGCMGELGDDHRLGEGVWKRPGETLPNPPLTQAIPSESSVDKLRNSWVEVEIICIPLSSFQHCSTPKIKKLIVPF